MQDESRKRGENMSKENTVTGENDGEIKNCLFIQHCFSNYATISYTEWIAMITNVARCQGGAESIDKLSVLHQRYSVEEASAKIKQALDNMNPVTCLHIKHSLNFNECPMNGCGVKVPCGLALSRNLNQLD